MSLSTLGVVASWTSQHTTFAPSRAKRRAVARPMPLLAPVTIATFPWSLPRPFPSPGCSSTLALTIAFHLLKFELSDLLTCLPIHYSNGREFPTWTKGVESCNLLLPDSTPFVQVGNSLPLE